MNATDILLEITRLEKLLTNKGFTAPKIEISVGFSTRELTANISYKAGGEVKYQFIHLEALDGFEALIADTGEYIHGLKSVAEIQRDSFVASVGRLIDQGREIGVEVEFLNPLTAMMTKMSSNILTREV
jgi:hypothetical protein